MRVHSRDVAGDGGCSGIRLRLGYRTPYDWQVVLRYLSDRAIPGVETVDGDAYRRSAILDGRSSVIEVRPHPERVAVVVRVPPHVRRDLNGVAERVGRLFDLDADPLPIASHLMKDPRLAPLVKARLGIRVPGAWDPFELAVRAILGQQVSVRGATTLAGRLVEAFGRPIEGGALDGGPSHVFPDPSTLAQADVAQIGLPQRRAEAIRELSRRVHRGGLRLSWGECPVEAQKRLVEIPGIGGWTAGYIAMRGLGQRDIFLPSDLGVRRALADASGNLPSPREATRHADAWRPWRAYAMLYLWTGAESSPRPSIAD